MKYKNLKSGIARLLIASMLLADVAPVSAAEQEKVAVEETMEMLAALNEEIIGTNHGDDEKKEPVLKAEAGLVKLYNINATGYEPTLRPVLESTQFTVQEGEKQTTFVYGDENWDAYGMTFEMSAGYDIDSVIWGEGEYTISFSSTKEEYRSLAADVTFRVESPTELEWIGVNETIDFKKGDSTWYYIFGSQGGYFDFSATGERKAEVYTYSYGYFYPISEMVEDTLYFPRNIMLYIHVGEGNWFTEDGSFSLKKVKVTNLEAGEFPEIAMNYGTWGYSVITGSDRDFNGYPISSSNPIYNKTLDTSDPKDMGLLHVQLNLKATFENGRQETISSDRGEGRYLWNDLGIKTTFTKEDGSLVTTDEKGYLPVGSYMITYSASRDVKVDIPFKVKEKEIVRPNKISLAQSEITLKSGEYYSFNNFVNLEPTNSNTDCEVTVTSSDNTIVDASIYGLNPRREGTATVTFKTKNGKTATLKVMVEPAESQFYYIKYYENGADDYEGYQDAIYGQELTLRKDQFTRPGYEFLGWNTKPDGTGVAYEGGQTVKNLTGEAYGTFELFAQWKPIDCEVTFVGGTGTTGTMKNVKTTYDKSVTLAANAFKKTGYVFDGWSYGDGQKLANKAVVPASAFETTAGKLTLTAVWKPIEYTITYVNADKSNGVTKNQNPKTYTIETTSISLKDPIRPGYTFDGWYTSSSMTAASKVTTFEKPAKLVNVKLYAKWNGMSTKVVFNANKPAKAQDDEVTGTMADLELTLGKTKALTANTYKLKNYVFAGWSTAAAGKGTLIADKGQMPGDVVAANRETVTLYAQWKPVEYKITYANAIVGKADVTKNPNPDAFSVETANISLKDPTRAGYNFVGWYSKSSMKEEDKITAISTEKLAKVTVYAKWEAKTTSIRYDANKPEKALSEVSGSMADLAVTYGKTKALTATAYKLADYTFVGWNTAADGSGEAYANKGTIPGKLVDANANTVVTLYAQWKPISYKIKYANADKSKKDIENENPVSFTVEDGELILTGIPTKVGYTFAGWYQDSKCQKPMSSIDTTIRKPVTVYAKWVPNTYRIVYTSNYVTYGYMNSTAATYDKTCKLAPNTLIRPGYKFVGWSTVPNPQKGDKIYKNGASVKNLTADEYVVLYAQWK